MYVPELTLCSCSILMKGRANRLETDGMIPSTEDLAHNVALFSSSYDISAQIK